MSDLLSVASALAKTGSAVRPIEADALAPIEQIADHARVDVDVATTRYDLLGVGAPVHLHYQLGLDPASIERFHDRTDAMAAAAGESTIGFDRNGFEAAKRGSSELGRTPNAADFLTPGHVSAVGHDSSGYWTAHAKGAGIGSTIDPNDWARFPTMGGDPDGTLLRNSFTSTVDGFSAGSNFGSIDTLVGSDGQLDLAPVARPQA